MGSIVELDPLKLRKLNILLDRYVELGFEKFEETSILLMLQFCFLPINFLFEK